MKSIHGVMGQICHYFSWTLDYLLDYPDWFVVQRMLIDAPKYDTGKTKETTKEIKFTEQTADEVIAMLAKIK